MYVCMRSECIVCMYVYMLIVSIHANVCDVCEHMCMYVRMCMYV